MKKSILMVLMIALTASAVRAGESEDALRLQAQKVAIQEATKAIVKRMIDKTFLDPETYARNYTKVLDPTMATPSTTAPTPGAVVIAVYNIAKSAEAFHMAKNHHDRLMATLNGTAAALSVACPPAGAVLSVVLFGQGLIENNYSKSIAAIRLRTLEYQRRTAELRTEHLNSQRAEYIFVLNAAANAAKESQSNLERLDSECTKINSENQVEMMEKCIGYSTAATNQMQISLNMSRRLLSLPATDFRFHDFLNELEMTTVDYLARIEALEKDVAEMKAQTRDLSIQFSNFMAEVLIEQSKLEGAAPSDMYLAWTCTQFAEVMAQESIIYRLGLSKGNESRSKVLLTSSELIFLMEDFMVQDCESKIPPVTGELNPFDFVRDEIKTLKQLQSKLEKR